MDKTVNIAIDGPSGAGKSSTARNVAKNLGFLYVDTGALYRSIGWFVVQQGKDPSREEDVVSSLNGLSVSFRYVDGEQRVYVNGKDVSGEIRSGEMSAAASAVSAFPSVRAFLLQMQREIAEKENVVMDGRDIGTTVLPRANVKIFLTASAEVRAKRRYDEFLSKGLECTFETVLADVNRRDYDDSHREHSPLRQAEDAVYFDNSSLDEMQTVRALTELIQEKIAGNRIK